MTPNASLSTPTQPSVLPSPGQTPTRGEDAPKPLRINFGCGDQQLAGYVGVDIRPTRAAQYVLPAWDVTPFEPNSVDEVYSRHMLEHLNPQDARHTLGAWWKILRPGGKLRLIVPDLAFHAKQLLGLAQSWTSDFEENQQHALAGFYGWRDATRGGDREDAHRWGYTEVSLVTLLQSIGYARVTRVREGSDSEPWHLHLTAMRPVGVP